MAKDEWIRTAMSDDSVVAELLVRLKQSQASSPLKPPPATFTLPPAWGVRQPRSRALRCDSATAAPTVSQKTKQSQHGGGDSLTRFSPTTPLSWSGAASPSATGDGGCEESSRSPSQARSKGSNYELACTTTASKRSRKKTYAQLKEEESSLLNEKLFLKKELTKLRASFKEHSAANESLKKIKVDNCFHYAMNANPEGSTRPVLSQPQQRKSFPLEHSSRGESKTKNEKRSGFFLLPDLNSPASPNDYS